MKFEVGAFRLKKHFFFFLKEQCLDTMANSVPTEVVIVRTQVSTERVTTMV